MCGIAGIISSDPAIVNSRRLKSMTDAIAHRGPDAEGHWFSPTQQVGLGHRRLSIIDLSEGGHQPMHYLDRYTIVFNGEIYNYIELKKKLIDKGYVFYTNTDTEVILALYDDKREKCLEDMDGMFAFVLYDRITNQCFGARDRFGEKPFYYHIDQDHNIFFASEIKSLWAGGILKKYRPQALYNYLSQGLVSDPEHQDRTFYEQIYKIPQAHYFVFDIGSKEFNVIKYWEIDYRKVDERISLEKAKETFQNLLYDSIKRRLRSDVPIGSSLSGGLDSSLIVSLMDELITKSYGNNQKTFSARFPGFKKDESYFQDLVIATTHAQAHFVFPTELSMMENLNKVIYAQDEPFASASIAVQYEVYQSARQNGITVMLDGQGADEVLAGYHGYFYSYFYELKKKSLTSYKKEFEAYQLLHTDNHINPKIAKGLLRFLKETLSPALYHYIKNRYTARGQAKKMFTKDFVAANQCSDLFIKEDFHSLNEALNYSTFNYGLEDLLRYADRNSMAHSLEVRLPYLEHELVSFIYSLPASMKINQGWTKWIQRISFEEIMPKEIVWRKDKIGYEPPKDAWLKSNGLKNEIHESMGKLVDERIVNHKLVSSMDEMGNDELWRILLAGKMIN